MLAPIFVRRQSSSRSRRLHAGLEPAMRKVHFSQRTRRHPCLGRVVGHTGGRTASRFTKRVGPAPVLISCKLVSLAQWTGADAGRALRPRAHRVGCTGAIASSCWTSRDRPLRCWTSGSPARPQPSFAPTSRRVADGRLRGPHRLHSIQRSNFSISCSAIDASSWTRACRAAATPPNLDGDQVLGRARAARTLEPVPARHA